jgi:hypothetical protein
MKSDCTYLKVDVNKIILIWGGMDGKAGTWYDARVEYMKKFIKVDKWNPFVSAMQERLLNRQEERKALANMRELNYKGDIGSYLMDMETFNDKVCLVGTLWSTVLRHAVLENLQYRLSTTKRDP